VGKVHYHYELRQ